MDTLLREMTMTKLEKLAAEVQDARKRFIQAEEKYEAASNAIANEVKMTTRGEIITLKFGEKVVKVKQISRFHLDVYFNGVLIARDYRLGIHNLRVDFAEGRLL